MMKLKVLIGLILALIAGSGQAAPLKRAKPFDRANPSLWQSILPETPETHAIVEYLKVYRTYDAQGPIQLRRIGKAYDGGYVIPELAMREADVVMGYGISNDISFEDSATAIYRKSSYGFDCTCPSIQPMQGECHFIPSCIVSEHSIQQSSSFETFAQHLNLIGAIGKNVFLKMDIEGSEYDTLPDILQGPCNITGIVLELHFFMNLQEITQALHLLELLDKDFLLVHVHGNNHCRHCFVSSNAKGCITRVLELSYIHRRLVESYEVSNDQTHPTHLDMPNAPPLPDVAFTIVGKGL